MARDDWNYTTICPLAYTDIEVHYGDQYFITQFCREDNLGNSLTPWTACLYNDTAQNVDAGVVWGYEFDHWEFYDSDGCFHCTTENPISLTTCQTE